MNLPANLFLQKKFNFLVLVAVLVTTIFSWLRVNSLCIMLLVLCRLLHGGNPLPAIRRAFVTPIFLAYFAFFLIEAAGLLHANNIKTQLDVIAKDSTIVAIAFVFCAGGFAGLQEYRRLANAYILILAMASIYCLSVALRYYLRDGDTDVFFYHALTRPISQNAVLYAVFVLFGLILLLSPAGTLQHPALPEKMRRWAKLMLALFFIGMVILLNSKLILAIALLVLTHYFMRNFPLRRNRVTLSTAALVVLTTAGVILATDNPIRRRYQELLHADFGLIKREKFSPGVYFNAIELRLLEWRFGMEILDGNRAWVFGVSPGDSQDLLDEKYVTTNMYIGNPADGPHRKIRGFIGYNFHNQYLETLVRDGSVGLLILLVVLAMQFRLAAQYGTPEAVFFALTLILLFIPESPLTMQHGVFLFCFFPLLVPYSNPHNISP